MATRPSNSDDPDDPGTIENLRARTSVGNMSEEHWTKARKDLNQEELDYYRSRNDAPGVADCENVRSSYCLECDGVIPLEYDSRAPSDPNAVVVCPHCGAEQPATVRRMFNWVEIDQVHGSDFAALLPWMLGALVVLVGIAFLLLR